MNQKCSHCGKELPKTTEFFSKYKDRNNKQEPGKLWHTMCKQCELEAKLEENWKDGLLKCHVCGQYFPEETFHRIGHTSKKYHYRNNRDKRCPKCKVLINKACRTNMIDEDRLNTMLNSRFLGARDRAKRKGIKFNISKKYIKELWDTQKSLCALSKIPMTFALDGGRTFTNVSIDKINPNIGYIKGNIQLVCMAINQMKADMSTEELYMFAEALIKNKSNGKGNKTF